MEEKQSNNFFPRMLISCIVFICAGFVGAVLLHNSHILLQQTHITKALAKTLPSPTATPTPTAIPTPIPTFIPTATPTPRPTTDPTADAVWDRLAQCESGGNWGENTDNGYFGGLQFNQSAWESVGGSGNPAQASRTEQISRGKMLQARRGWSAWGGCSRELGLY